MIQVKGSNFKKLMEQVMTYSIWRGFQTVFMKTSGSGGTEMEIGERPGEKIPPL